MDFSKLPYVFQYGAIPLAIIIVTCAAPPFLTQLSNPENPFHIHHFFGNIFAWKCVGLLLTWSILGLLLSSDYYHGPTTSSGNSPVYKRNGEFYYFSSLLAFIFLVCLDPQITVTIFENMGPILGALNVTALSFCVYLFSRGKLQNERNQNDKYPVTFQFFQGIELHPRLLGVDVKQWTGVRLGMLMWQLLILTFLVAGWKMHGFDFGHFVNVSLQTIYIYKTFRLETTYFTMIDMTKDHAGYYLCWGSLVWIPAFYTFSSCYFVLHRPGISFPSAIALLAFGVAFVWLNYDVLRQKKLFRRSISEGKFVQIWGHNAESVRVSSITSDGKLAESQLLITGWWGIARKINYTFELCATGIWCGVGGFQFGVWPFIYFIFLTGLLTHRVFRDEKMCKEKYGNGWELYCSKVKYRLVPFVF